MQQICGKLHEHIVLLTKQSGHFTNYSRHFTQLSLQGLCITAILKSNLRLLKRIYTLLSVFIFQYLQAQDTTILDRSFAESGIFTFSASDGSDNAHAIAIQPDNKIIVAGNGDYCNLVRLHGDGSVDSTFGVNGIAHWTRYSNDEIVLCDIGLQPDGKILVVGYMDDGEAFMTRLLPGGDKDVSFNGGYQLLYGSPDYYEYYYLYDLALQSDGKIVYAGLYYESSFFSSNTDMLLVRLNPDGTFDNTFAGDGKNYVSALPGGGNIARAVHIQPDGKYLVGGYYTDDGEEFLQVCRFLPEGPLDTTFNGSGYFRKRINGEQCRINDITQNANGKVICSGFVKTPDSELQALILQLNSDGTADSLFGTDGYWLHAPESSSYFRTIKTDSSGRIFASGTDKSGYKDYDMFTVVLTPEGRPDSSFGQFGMIKTAVSKKDDVVYDLILTRDDKILVAGVQGENSLSTMSVVRYLDKAVDIPFDTLHNSFTLQSVYPNPIYNTTLTLQYFLLKADAVTAQLFSITGQRVALLMDQVQQEAGQYTTTLTIPAGLSPGYFLLELQAGTFVQRVKLIIL